jgi:hypothetical protein
VVDLFLFLGLSEPPDIRNWFASYVYESPVLDTSNYFGYSLSKESECEYDGVVNEESNIETGETLGEVIVGENVQSDGVVKCDNSFGNNLQKQQPSREVFHLSFLHFHLSTELYIH